MTGGFLSPRDTSEELWPRPEKQRRRRYFECHSAALRAAELGAKVAVVEGDRTGGTCVNTGCVPTPVLAKAARLMREIRTAETYGIEVEHHPLDWSTTVARVQQRVDRVRSIKREAERFADAGIELVLEGRGRFTDAQTVVVESGRRLTADTFIVYGSRSGGDR